MNIKVLRGDLVEVLGEKLARSKWAITLGANCMHQLLESDEMISFFEITDQDVWNNAEFNKSGIQTLTSIEQVNVIIESYNEDIYTKENEGLMNANMTYLVSQGTIKFDDMDTSRTEQEELAYLYSKGCSGISKSRKYQLLSLR